MRGPQFTKGVFVCKVCNQIHLFRGHVTRCNTRTLQRNRYNTIALHFMRIGIDVEPLFEFGCAANCSEKSSSA